MLLYAPFLLLLSQLAEGAKKPCQQEPAFVGPCRAAKPRWTYQQDRNTCSEFQYGGCKGNENNFNTQADCERACLVAPKTEDAGGEEKTACEQEPAIVGPCRASKPRWTFRPTLGECVEFTYGGCDGNENNFESKQACEASCGGPTQADPKTPAEQREEAGENVDICQLLPFAPEPQLCRASIQAFSYDYQKRQCMEFMYGGCEGNANNFESMEECEAACPPVPQCEQPPFSPTPQICRASLTAYSYNPETGACEDYVFGGCGENLNHFGTKEECEASCISQPERLPSSAKEEKPTPAKSGSKKYLNPALESEYKEEESCTCDCPCSTTPPPPLSTSIHSVTPPQL